MKSRFREVLFLYGLTFSGVLFFAIQDAHANELESITHTGTGTLTEGLTYNGEAQSDSNKDKERTKHSESGKGLHWTVGYTYTANTLGGTLANPSPTPATTGNEVDHTNAVTGGLGYEKDFEFGGNLNYARTKEENLTSFGPAVYLGYTFKLAATNEKEITLKKEPAATAAAENEDEEIADKEFTPTLNLKLTGATNTYSQDFGAATRKGTRRKANNAKGSQNIQQKQMELDITLSPWDWIDLKLVYIKYTYNKDVATFLSKLDDPRAIRTGAATFGSTLSGFASKETAIQFTFHLPWDLDLEADLDQSTNAVDSSKINTFKFDLSRIWDEKWKTGLGFERNKSPTDTQNLGVITLAYEF